LEKYPSIDLNLDVSNGLANLHAREVDVALRASDDPPDTLVGRRLGRMAATLYGPKDFVAPGELGAKPEAQAPLTINYASNIRDWQQQGWFLDVYPHAKQRMVTQSPETIQKAVQAGMGIGMLPCFMGDMDPSLRRLPPYRLESMYDLWLLTHADLRKTARVRAFINFLADAMAPHKDLIEGRRPPQFTSGDAMKSSAYAAAE
jgi:DNA-binding transcriptional LysR family regulator